MIAAGVCAADSDAEAEFLRSSQILAFARLRTGRPGKLPPPIIDGYTAEQRLFIGWAQVWARNFRDEEMITRLKTGPHAPDVYRTNGVVRNIDAWYPAFDIDEDAPLYLPPEARVSIW